MPLRTRGNGGSSGERSVPPPCLRSAPPPGAGKAAEEANDADGKGERGQCDVAGPKPAGAAAHDDEAMADVDDKALAHIPAPPQQQATALSPPLDAATSNDMFPLLGAMMDVLCNDSDSGVFLTVLEQLRSLLDPSTMRSTVEKERFLDVFYERFVSRLLSPLKLAKGDDVTVSAADAEAASRARSDLKSMDDSTSHICDLLAFCVLNHAFRVKYFILGSDVVGKVLRLLHHRRPHVRLAALRFCRACIGASDDMIDRYLCKNALLKPVFDVFAANGHRDNLLNSAVLELVSFVAAHHRMLLLQDIVDHHSTVLEESLAYSVAFADARKSLHEIKANMNNPAVAVGAGGGGQLVGGFASGGGVSGGDSGGGDGSTHGMVALESHANRFGSSLFSHHDIRIAPDQDEDEDYFASGDEEDAGVNELSRIMDGTKSPGAAPADQALLPDGPDGVGSSGGAPSGPGLLKTPGRELMPVRRLSILRGAGPSGSGPLASTAAAVSEAGPRCSSPTGMSVSFPLGVDDDVAVTFDDAVLNSTWSNRAPGQRSAPLVDYPFDNEPEDMFASDSNADMPSTSGPGAGRHVSRGPAGPHGGPARGGVALSLKWEGGGPREATRPVTVGGSGSNSSGSSGGVGRLFDTVSSGSNGRSDSGGVSDHQGSSPQAGSPQGGTGSGDTVVLCDSDSDAPSSPKKRRREAPDAEGNLPGGGMEVSTKRLSATSSGDVDTSSPPTDSAAAEKSSAADGGLEKAGDAESTGSDAVEEAEGGGNGQKRQRVSPGRSPPRSPSVRTADDSSPSRR
jgi:uncharacterized membrane protein YgcG